MTAKRRGRAGFLARLEALEEKEAERVEEVRARNSADMEEAEGKLSPADRAAWREAARVLEEGADPDALERMGRACAHLPEHPPVSHPAKEGALAWAWALGDTPEGVPLPRPDPAQVGDFCAFFEACARWNEEEARRFPLSPDMHRLARWGAALWRFEASLCRVLGGKS